MWVYHWPPLGSPTCWTGRRHYGDDELGGWIDEHRPDVVLTGHVHEPPFKPDGGWADRIGDTWVFNAGRQIGPSPTRIELDLDEQRATWMSLLGTEEIGLAGRGDAGSHRLLISSERVSSPGRDRGPSPGSPPARCVVRGD